MDPFVPSDAEALVTLGVDTHADVHVCVALDRLGRRLGNKSVPTKQAGYAELVGWAEGFGALDRVGIEGSGSFGVGLARFLRARGVRVVEVNRPNRQHRRRFGKHDTADAEAAARAVQANVATGEPKAATTTIIAATFINARMRLISATSFYVVRQPGALLAPHVP